MDITVSSNASKVSKPDIEITTPLREITCHMRSHSVTCHPAEVTFPPLPQPKLVLDLATPEGCKAELTWWWLYPMIVYPRNTVTYLRNNQAVSWPGFEPGRLVFASSNYTMPRASLTYQAWPSGLIYYMHIVVWRLYDIDATVVFIHMWPSLLESTLWIAACPLLFLSCAVECRLFRPLGPYMLFHSVQLLSYHMHSWLCSCQSQTLI